jgi:hypothetical protein
MPAGEGYGFGMMVFRELQANALGMAPEHPA